MSVSLSFQNEHLSFSIRLCLKSSNKNQIFNKDILLLYAKFGAHCSDKNGLCIQLRAKCNRYCWLSRNSMNKTFMDF